MDLQSRKIEFVQEFLKLQSEEVISSFEKLLEKQTAPSEKEFEPMSVEELNDRIDQSENDFKNGRFKTHSEIIAKYR